MIDKKRLLTLTQKLIHIHSENPPGNEAEIAAFVRSYLKNFGVPSKLYEFARNRTNVVALMKARVSGAKTILISPHLDTVPVGFGWKFPPFEGCIKNGKIYGRGVTDCKCNLAVAMEVLQSLSEEKVPLINTILFAATADEEAGSNFGLIPLLKKNIIKADYALILDADEFDVVVAQKGLIHFKISVFGKKAHGAYPWRGINAITIANDIIQDLRKVTFRFTRHPLLHPPTLNIGTIAGGDKVNMVADWCDIEVDVRYLPGMSAQKLLAVFKKLISRRARKFKLQIDGIQNPYEIDRQSPLVKALLKTWHNYKPHAALKGSEGATVITFFKEKNIPAVATGFGSYECAHANDEYARVDNLYHGAKALEEFLRKGL